MLHVERKARRKTADKLRGERAVGEQRVVAATHDESRILGEDKIADDGPAQVGLPAYAELVPAPFGVGFEFVEDETRLPERRAAFERKPQARALRRDPAETGGFGEAAAETGEPIIFPANKAEGLEARAEPVIRLIAGAVRCKVPFAV